jgi:nucleotide-binding universal stress UspA family protein
MVDSNASPTIVVGVDGSEDSLQALRWAAHHALLTGGKVRAVTGWEVPATIVLSPTYTEADYARDAQETLQRSVRDALGPDPGVPVVTQLVQDRPARALVNEAEQADLLVIGRHGRGELPGVHLGTVASYCIHHAPCPVVVVRKTTHV